MFLHENEKCGSFIFLKIEDFTDPETEQENCLEGSEDDLHDV